MSDKLHTCCICNREFKGWGNNPDPFPYQEGAVCCDSCDQRFVIPARIVRMVEEEQKAHHQ